MLHLNVVENPSAIWTAQQLRESFAFTAPPHYLLRDRDGIYGLEFQSRAQALGLEEVRIAPRSPWQSPYVERFLAHLNFTLSIRPVSLFRCRCIMLKPSVDCRSRPPCTKSAGYEMESSADASVDSIFLLKELPEAFLVADNT